jgi:hypothetical protein
MTRDLASQDCLWQCNDLDHPQFRSNYDSFVKAKNGIVTAKVKKILKINISCRRSMPAIT